MRRGSFIRKRWKIESVGRGRYIIRSEWTQKCLYKTRLRKVEENDCRSWSPSQEWVLRPLLTRAKPEKKTEPKLPEGVNFQIPSRVVDEHLAEKRREKEKEEVKKKKTAQKYNAAYLEPYRIRRKKKPSSSLSDEEEADDNGPSRPRPKQRPPPKPEVLYTPSGIPLYGITHTRPNRPQLSYYNGIYPVYEDVKVEDPIFPDFLLNTEVRVPKKSSSKNKKPYAAPEYQVTRRPPVVPYPDLPNLPKPKPKYSSIRGRSGIPAPRKNKKKKVAVEEESENDNKTDEVEDEGEDGEGEDEEQEQEQDDIPEQEDPEGNDKELDADDDPAADVASFLKLLFKGISKKMNTGDKNKEEMLDLFE